MAPLTDLVVQAGQAILAVNRHAMKIADKSDGSPVTEADLAADRIIGDGLARLAPDIATLSEERVHLARQPDLSRYQARAVSAYSRLPRFARAQRDPVRSRGTGRQIPSVESVLAGRSAVTGPVRSDQPDILSDLA